MNHSNKLLIAGVLILGGIFMSASPALAATTGPNNPGTVVSTPGSDGHGTVAWSDPSNAQVQDSDYATATLIVPGQTVSNYLKASNFGFNLPNDATVLGVEVNINRQASLPGVKDDVVRIFKGGMLGDNKADVDNLWPTTEAVASYGGADDLWGQTWTVTDINSASFGLLISARLGVSTPTTDVASINSVQVSVTYSVPDTTAPVITLLGDNPVNLTVGDPYVDAGATALDKVDGDITTNIVTTITLDTVTAVTPTLVDNVDTSAPGIFTVHYNVFDAAGNPAVEVTRTVNVNATPVPVTHTLTYTAGPNGSIDGPTPQEVNDGEDGAAVTAVANAGFHFVNWSDASTANPRTDINVTADISVTANFTADDVPPPGDTTAPTLVSYTVSETTISPNGDGIADSTSIDIRYSEEVEADINILNSEGVKVRDLYSSPAVTNPEPKVWDGKNNSDVVVPDGVYTIEILGTDPAGNELSDTSRTVTVDTSVPDPDTHTLTYTAGANGSITGTLSQEVNDGEDGTAVTAVADAGFHFVDWSDGSTDNPRTDTNVTADISVTANFAADDVPPPADSYDETIAIDAGEWALISAPRLLSEKPSVTDDEGDAVALLVYRDGTFVIPSADADELINPLSAFYVKTDNGGEVGFNFADNGLPENKQLTEGWNLVGVGYSGTPINVFSVIVYRNDRGGVTTLNVPLDYNDNKNVGGVWDGITGDIDISRWNTDDVGDVNPYDGYWVNSSADVEYSLVPQPE